jgi:hypothetical protein
MVRRGRKRRRKNKKETEKKVARRKRRGERTFPFMRKSGSSRSSRGVLDALLLVCSVSSLLLLPLPFARESKGKKEKRGGQKKRMKGRKERKG